MDFDLFKKENEIIKVAETALEKGHFDEDSQKQFQSLLGEYKKLSKHAKRLINLSDRNELKLRDAGEEIKRQKKELERRQEELVQAEKMASLGQLVTGVAHELNTPLGIILTSSSSLRSETNHLNQLIQNAKAKKSDVARYMVSAQETCDLLERHSQSASELISSFKAVSVDQAIDDKRDIELRAYVKSIVRSLKPVLTGHNVQVIFQNSPVAIPITTYPGPLSQVITNLVLNAYKHGFEEGRLKGMIEISLKTGDEIELSVCDNGKGIAAEVQGKIFDPFITTARDSGGTGLGLHIVHNIVFSKLQGHIKVEQPKNEMGCRFVIALPKALKEE
ncbi:putative sensor histidine kinase [Candidatus Terasakiella magnetica]|uniref:histidine kinase n=1 Tax=Candidatus Terasakiella magnetica TaxID=1867952 RepID=A0A1C3REA0_9PROT|nr:HAMP domain-containing sensor histidine kinase [Candidatus Terasakiella magnetica]SCA55554.1 putative sensor histidine kinase [Candidatus Terasakiella magnetica]